MSRAVGGLEKAVETMTTQWADQERAATEGRRILHEKIDQLRQDQAKTAAELGTLKASFDEIKPAVQRFERERLQVEGMKKLGGFLWLGILAIAGLIGWAIHEAVNFWKGPPPPH